MSDEPPPRPSTFEDLGFEPRRPVIWFSPTELLLTAKQLAISKVFGDYADKRELVGTLPDPGVCDYTDRDELWIDYVSDLGDGFDATYSVASVLVAEKLDLPGPAGDGATPTRRGDILVMGGDEVYPAASIEEYEERTVGPYRAALPHADARPTDLFAIPGNHDWYDGLTAWMRIFAQRKLIGGWQTHQARSYFALQLPHRWWLWGIDVQFDSYIDAPQMDYFRRVVEDRVQQGDQIILCSATPEWVNSHRNDPESFRNLDYFERTVIVPSGATLRVAVSGDAHHYAHYVSDEADLHRLTSGGGGAYLSATHGLPDTLSLPPEASLDRHKTHPAVPFRRVAEYPHRDVSARLGRGVWRLPLDNPSFVGLLAAVYGFYTWSGLSIAAAPPAGRSPAAAWRAYADAAAAFGPDDAVLGLIGRPLALLASLLLTGALFGLTKRRGGRRLRVGSAHLVAQAAVLVGSLTLAFAIARGLPTAAALPLGVALGVGLGSIAASLTLAAYLSFGDTFGLNVNEQFSAMHIEDHKNFLRMHVGADGALTIYPVGLPEVVHEWQLDPDARAEDPHLIPDDGTLTPELIEPPIRIAHEPGVWTRADR